MNNDTQNDTHYKLQQHDENERNKLLILVCTSLIPVIITANLLSIFGIFKAKWNKFASLQILFLTLFVTDLTVGVVQLPIHI